MKRLLSECGDRGCGFVKQPEECCCRRMRMGGGRSEPDAPRKVHCALGPPGGAAHLLHTLGGEGMVLLFRCVVSNIPLPIPCGSALEANAAPSPSAMGYPNIEALPTQKIRKRHVDDDLSLSISFSRSLRLSPTSSPLSHLLREDFMGGSM